LKLTSNLSTRLSRIFTLPPGIVIGKISRILKNRLNSSVQKFKDKNVSSYIKDYPQGALNSYFPSPERKSLLRFRESLAGVCSNYLSHRFDLLGSGWIIIKHGKHCRGVEGHRYDDAKAIAVDSDGNWLEEIIGPTNLQESKRIWRLIHTIPEQFNGVTHSYTPIDWQLDVKSGYRWNDQTRYDDVQISPCAGADIKVPWELARMQHLIPLALACCIAFQGNSMKNQSESIQFEPPEKYGLEFRNQVLDFIATNPPRYGVNWQCAMEVAIRVSNWLMAYDLFRQSNIHFDHEFEEIFTRSIYEHSIHIINNLEWNEEQRTNHYLADIVGLLFIAAYLPDTPITDAWLAFAVQELVKEAETQFYPDGCNFEASTSYHRFAAEILIYAIALVLSLPRNKLDALKSYNHKAFKVHPKLNPPPLPFYKPSESKTLTPIPPDLINHLKKIAEFTINITKPNGQIVQIGDNDSGRFFKIQPVMRKTKVADARLKYANLDGYNHLPDDHDFWEEDFLDHRSLVAAINGLMNINEYTQFTGDSFIETELIRKMAHEFRGINYTKQGSEPHAYFFRYGSGKDMEELVQIADRMNPPQKQIAELRLSDDIVNDELDLFGYPDFGVYIYRSERFYLLVRCGSVGQNGFGGHSHNDQLSIELQIDHKDYFVDPGTYLYTPLPELRNQYRSVRAHFGPQLIEETEPGRLDLNLFLLPEQAYAECLYFQKNGFAGLHYGYGDPVYRLVCFGERSIRFIDFTTDRLSLKPIDFLSKPFASKPYKVPVSPGYGLKYS
jgi:hypothetical protein